MQARFSLLIFLFKLLVSDNACGTNTNQCFHSPPPFFNGYFLSLPSLPGVSSNGPSITVFPLSFNIFFAVKSITVTLFIELWLL